MKTLSQLLFGSVFEDIESPTQARRRGYVIDAVQNPCTSF